MQIIGHTQIDNEFIDSMYKYKEYDVKVFLAISRKTIGWHKETDRISYSQLIKITGLCVNSLKKGIKNLINDGWIIQVKTKNGYEYDLNIVSSPDTVNYKGCHPMTQTVSPHDTVEVKTMSCHDTTKEINIKETNKRNIAVTGDAKDTSHADIRKHFESLNCNYYHNGKHAKAINNLISRFKSKEKIIEYADKLKKIKAQKKTEFWTNVPITPHDLMSNIDRVIEYDLAFIRGKPENKPEVRPANYITLTKEEKEKAYREAGLI